MQVRIDRKFYIEQEKIYLWRSKTRNEPSEPKHGIWVPKSVFSSISMALMAYFHLLNPHR
jgi:hypothetical protein